MFQRVLIANRGEIALRVIRACRDLGIEAVTVHSEADRDSLHVRLADRSLCIGPPPPRDSYLSIPALMAAAELCGADAVHPGYGFLAEDAEFAAVVERCGLCWIGPPPAAMDLMGNKVRAREAAVRHGLPVLPGTGALRDAAEAREQAAAIGYPVLIKAASGGGGRGMKVVTGRERIEAAFATASSEAQAAFGDGTLYLERYVPRPRHVEVQVLGDLQGNLVHLWDRECSVQRRHQKLVEEAPAPALDDRARRELCERAAAAARAFGYHSAGTFEFLWDADRGEAAFMEMNTRIQVEHTVTEEVTGVDLVREQIRVAAGAPLALSQANVPLTGCAIELRINAEDPRTFAPSPGRITALALPAGPGVRVDTHVYPGYLVPPHYDSLLAKLIVRGEDRPAALRRLRRALAEVAVEGIATNVDLFRRLLDLPDFAEGRLDTHILERLP